MLKDKNIVLGVCGGIAAYKAVEIVSRLRKEGASVHCIMTENATRFVTPLTFGEISGNPVVSTMWHDASQWNVEHIALATMADAFLIAPATANLVGKLANGIADDMLSTTTMATKAPVVLVPAMNTNMYLNPIMQGNLQKLSSLNYRFMEPASGSLACGTTGVGRLPEPEDIVEFLKYIICGKQLLAGKKVLVTAGGTQEPIDPVRYIGNRSSGTMGFAIAKMAAMEGAEVTLIASPTGLPTPFNVTRIDVQSALEMKAALDKRFDATDVVVKAAAVADYRVKSPAKEKIKKNDDTLTIQLEKNPDILYGLGQRKSHQILVGFAAETMNVIEYGKGKLKKKNLDMIVANDVSKPGAGFNVKTNIASLIFPDGTVEELGLMSKENLAHIIIKRVSQINNLK
jgi:phosphopantothenoylcysteine decarboxylase/phosphopantothenate--cysteine ligase